MKYIFVLLLFTVIGIANAQSKLDQDRETIKSLAGFYKVTFNFAETFSPDTAYKFHNRYHSWGDEWVVILEDSPKKIVLQHLLVVGDSTIIKHWREDWLYEEPTTLAFAKDNTWKKVTRPITAVKGQWTQKVYQVDDSPPYESSGSWVHVDGRHQWQSEADSPLPRREFSKRNDYNVLHRGNRVYLTTKGWMYEQDNTKIIRSESGDKILAMEKGYEEFTKEDSSKFVYAQTWWKQQQSFWKDVRSVWAETYAKNSVVNLTIKKDGKTLFEQLFDLADLSAKEKWDSTKNITAVKQIINSYMIIS